jgi:hypothetical protein
MDDMFAQEGGEAESRRLAERRREHLDLARSEVKTLLEKKDLFAAHEVWAAALVVPFVTINDAKKILGDLVSAGRVEIKPRDRQRVPDADTMVRVV